ncbi:MAG: PDZ domain-containing protein [Desulfobacteraceae bacterium]|nr:PDZ domain-containing protein [Desulfobacteraceae bacterium]
MNKLKLKFYFTIVFMFLCFCVPFFASSKLEKGFEQTHETAIAISIKDIDIKVLVHHFKKTFDVEISGLAHLYNQTITLEISGELPFVIKKILRKLNQDNYALVFENAVLKKVVVVPGHLKPVKKKTKPKDEENLKEADTANLSQVSVVRDVIENSLAEEIGLQKDDIILEYDGMKITHYNELMEQIKMKPEGTYISMLIVRNKIPRRLACKAGILGVVMSQKTMNASLLEAWYAY